MHKTHIPDTHGRPRTTASTQRNHVNPFTLYPLLAQSHVAERSMSKGVIVCKQAALEGCDGLTDAGHGQIGFSDRKTVICRQMAVPHRRNESRRIRLFH
jgi:hypothetical protein